MAPVTIYKNNQLGISINVEEHEESNNSNETAPAGGIFSNPLKKLERLTSRSKIFQPSVSVDDSKMPEQMSLITSQDTRDTRDVFSSTTMSSSCYRRPSRRSKLKRKQIIQGRIYMFLEHPTGWLCFAYHMGV